MTASSQSEELNQQSYQLLPSPPPTPDEPAIVLRTVSGIEIRLLPPSAELCRQVADLVRSRRNWMDIPGADASSLRRISDVLYHLGLPPQPDLPDQLVKAGVVEVSFPPGVDRAAWTFPWEFALAKWTADARRAAGLVSGQFLVYRHLPAQGASLSEVERLLVVESAPGRIGEIYSFESERRMVVSSLELSDIEPLINPTLKELEQRIADLQPHIAHLTGVDAQQGLALLGAKPDVGESGMLLADGVAPFEELAATLTSAGSLQFAGFNLYNSSLGAGLAVERGAYAALGFQDEIDDALAEALFASFYAAWRQTGFRNVLEAFRQAWRVTATQAHRRRGTGVVLWSRASLLEIAEQREARTPPSHILLPLQVQDDPASYFDIKYQAPQRLNYSLLHNNANIIPEFIVRRQRPGAYKGLKVEVKLMAGAEEAVYRETFDLSDASPSIAVHQRVRVPLTAELTRRLDESIFSTIYATVRWGPHVLLENTNRVEFLPVDEWKYDELNGCWLPSFVFPRDPAVRQIVDAAQRYLTALRDDSAAGFDGYQSYDPEGSSLSERCAAIDAQVQAIWWALINDYGLSYINPPPSFTEESQRLRTPSEVIQGRRGTCIDLTLLLAACLEYVDIYPVIFLLNDHAFPGYWRSEESYQRLSTAMMQSPALAAAQSPDAPWMLTAERYAMITKFVQQGHILPLESTMLTSRSGFWAAVEEGLQNLRSKRQFDSLFDLKTARNPGERRGGVKPLPLWSKSL